MPTTKWPRRALIAAFGVIVAVAAFAGPAQSAPYSNQTTTSVSDQTPAAGSSFTLTGAGFGAKENVTNVLHSDPVTLTPAVSDASGNFSVVVSLPAGVTGAHTIVSTGATTGRVSTVAITIGGTTSAAASTGGLALTGGAMIAVGSLAVLLLLGGALMVLAGRRRRIIA